jgi:hypothetical protein
VEGQDCWEVERKRGFRDGAAQEVPTADVDYVGTSTLQESLEPVP